MKARQPRLMCTLSCARHVHLLGEASRDHPVGCDDEHPFVYVICMLLQVSCKLLRAQDASGSATRAAIS